MKHQKSEDFAISFRCSGIDKRLVQEMAESMNSTESDIMKLSLWDFATSPKNKLLRDSLKELAFQRKKSFEIGILKELEFINNQQAFFIDGFRNSLDNYHKKHVPMPYVERFVVIKLIGLYGVLRRSSERKEYMDYLEQHFCYFYPSKKKWLQSQIFKIRSMKKSEKDKLLMQIRTDISKDSAADFDGHVGQDGSVDSNILKKLPLPKRKAIEKHLDKEKAKKDARLQFYQNKDKYFKSKEAKDGQSGKDSPSA